MDDDISLIRHLDTNQLLATIPSGLFVVDLESRIVYWNPAAERITGFTAAEAVGQHCSFLRGIPCGNRCSLFNTVTDRPTRGGSCTITSKSGERVHLFKNVDFLRDSEGRVIGGIESFADITRQRQLEEALRKQAAELEQNVAERTGELVRSETRLRAVLDSMDDLAYIAGPDYRLHLMNRAMRNLYDNRIGDICYRTFYGSDRPCSWCAMTRVLNGETVREERTLNTNQRIYEIIHSPLLGEAGAIEKLSVCRDITERKGKELLLREANQELDAFAHSISHDLRGLLAPVVTYMDFLRMEHGDVLDPQIMQVLAEVERQSERAITLLDDLLDLARVGQITASDKLIDVAKLVAEVIRENPAGEDGSRPEVQVGELPPLAIPESLAFQVFANLIGNAMRYAGPTGGPVEVGYREQDGRRIYYVRDHGPGVEPRERDKIFEIFHRGTASRGNRGTGVGLAIVRKIAHRYQGDAWVEDTPGGGATFCIAFPHQAT